MADKSADITQVIQVAYMATIRKKLGEFMLVIRDLINRQVISSDNHSRLPEDIVKIITEGSQPSTSNWAGSQEMKYLTILLYNNGYPVQIINKTAVQEAAILKLPPSKDFDNKNALYKMYIV